MNNRSFTSVIQVPQSPMVAFDAINQPNLWWGREIDGTTNMLHEEWTYRYGDVHFSRQRIVELVPAKRIVWHVVDSDLDYVSDPAEWTGTDLVFEISRTGDLTEVSFTHAGLVPDIECFDFCSNSWTRLIQGSLRRLIMTGQGTPDVV